MSDLRRRIFGAGTPDSSPSSSRDASPGPSPLQHEDGEYKVIPKPTLDKLREEVKQVKRKGTKRRNFWIFVLGGLSGIFVAGFFASSDGSLDKLVELAGIRDMNLDSILDVLPAGLIKDVQNLQVRSLSAAHSCRWLMLTKFPCRQRRNELLITTVSPSALQLGQRALKPNSLSS